jgi:hypothetical protein
LKTARNWTELQNALKNRHIELKYKYKGHTNVIQGVSFSKDNATFKGSEIDRSFSFTNLDRQLAAKGNLYIQRQSIVSHGEESEQRSASLIDFGTGFFDFPVNHPENEEYDPNRLRKKKKRRLKL